MSPQSDIVQSWIINEQKLPGSMYFTVQHFGNSEIHCMYRTATVALKRRENAVDELEFRMLQVLREHE